MREYKILNIDGALLDKNQLERYLEKVASNHNLKLKSDRKTYPVPRMLENYEVIKDVYDLLNEHVKLGINIHPAGEWLLDNFYIIEETVKSIQKELSLKKYTNFLGIQNGYNKGFARIYVLATEIVAYTNNKIEKEDLERYLQAYQTKKTLSMDEIWNISIFLEIAIIEKIREICERIYVSQVQKYKVENMVERLVEQKDKSEQVFNTKNILKNDNKIFKDMKYPFIEYMSYVLKRYGKKANSYLKILEEEVEKTGTTVSEVIKKEHFDIAVRRVSIGNSITSLKTILRINFLEIFERINGVEEILRQDPAGVYDKMDYRTKDYYRNVIKEISKKTKISEFYIANKILKLAMKSKNKTKKQHIGYYLIDEGINLLYSELEFKKNKKVNNELKSRLYVFTIYLIVLLFSYAVISILNKCIHNIWISLILGLISIIPISELIIQLAQYILGKIVKPKMIPKLDFSNGINKENATMVIIPTILNSRQKVKDLMQKLEVFYLSNKSENIYFTLLGDCTQSSKEKENIDEEIIQEGLKQVKFLNKKYSKENDQIFNFLYRNRIWNEKENSYLGWERKRGAIHEFNEYMLGNSKNTFRVNTINKIPKIKYIITLDADTDLVLNTAFELIGAMAHVLNTPVIDKKRKIVVDGYGLIQPRIGVNLNISHKNLFTELFAGAGGIDSYTNAISDIYQDNFGEGIFTGKAIYDLEVFSEVLSDAFPENTVLSHDLLEGNYLRCGLATDILLMDGYPSKYTSFMSRLSRWIRGDWQISKWLNKKIRNSEKIIKNPLNFLSKYKILDNLRRSLFEVSVILEIVCFKILEIIYNVNLNNIIISLLTILIFPFILEIIDSIIFKKQGEERQKTFTPEINGIKGAFLRVIITLGCVPHKAYESTKAIIKTLYRKIISKRNLLEWVTSEEAEKLSNTDIISYYKMMFINIILGILLIISSIKPIKIYLLFIAVLWLLAPLFMCYISKDKNKIKKVDKLSEKDKEYVYKIGEATWQFFKDNLNKDNNYLITDNYQESRLQATVNRTSSTNIGLSLLAVVSAYDLKYSNLKETIELLNNIIKTVEDLQKWNGHLYNWYNIKTKEPLIPRYISTVDSGNFIGYLYVIKQFLLTIINEPITIKRIKKQDIKNKYKLDLVTNNIQSLKEKSEIINTSRNLLKIIDCIIEKTDFKVLYNDEKRLFSIGFNIEENKLTNSYYDLLASEARQASLVAIAKRDISSKHWNNLSRTLTNLDKYKGLLSWSGTAFEYLMPNINIPRYEGSLLDESSKFAIMSQMQYCKKLGISWGMSEAAFNLKDLQSNYQYKAFGIPWLGLKRGLADEFVISSYGSILAINEMPNEVVENLKRLEKEGMLSKYGFYEAIDYTPSRLEKGKKFEQVKTYMAHHQGLILISINNLFNNNITQTRFAKNPEMQTIEILLQERMPTKTIIAKEDKKKLEKLKYKDYENYSIREYNKLEEEFVRGNVISNDDYTVAINQNGLGVSKFKEIYINRYKKTDDYPQGIFFYIKNIKNKAIWSTNYNNFISKPDKYNIKFMPDQDEFERVDQSIETKMKVTVALNENVEIRRLEIKNFGKDEETLEIYSYFEPVLSNKKQDYSHPAFNNLFLVYEYDEDTKNLIVKRKKRAKSEKEVYLATQIFTESETIGDYEFEIDKEKFFKRGNLEIPQMIKKSLPLSNDIGLVTDPIVAMKRTIKIKPDEKIYIDLVLSVDYEREKAIENLNKYKNKENVNRIFELSRAKVEAQNRYLGIKSKDIDVYQKMLSYMIFRNPLKSIYTKNMANTSYKQSDLWKYGISGDLPIILVKIKDVNDIYVVGQVLKAYEFFRTKNFEVEIVIMDEEKHSYENYVREEIETAILNHQIAFMKNIRGGIFVIPKGEIEKEDINLFKVVADIIIDARKGELKVILDDLEEESVENYKKIESKNNNIMQPIEESNENINIIQDINTIKYYNEYGGFSNDGKEYLIVNNKEKRLPSVWSHVMANEKFGTIITENGGGYSWYKNSRLNRVTAWNNSAVFDIPSEVIYLKDKETEKTWSLGCNPKGDNNNYNVIYGFGYAKYIHSSNGITQELNVFVPKEDSAKINILKLRNGNPTKKKIQIIYYIKPVIGEDEIKSNSYLDINYEKNSNIVTAKNIYNNDLENNIIYVSSSEKINSYTGDKTYFLGSGGIINPDTLKMTKLNNDTGLGKNSCIAIELDIELESFSEKEISIILGAENQVLEAKNTAYKYSKISNCKNELEVVTNYWKDILEKIKVKTPTESINIILNGWALYQTIACRLVGRSGFYQSGGAFGYRDQLQDTLALKYIDSNYLKKQIIKHSEHQFIEGDVEHWWHDENKKGIRTRFSDDLLWLVFITLEYIELTGDNSILEIETNYIKGPQLKENEDERYDKYEKSETSDTIYEHCKKSINKVEFGENYLPKIGSGDWNDGFSEVGNKGKGESVWLGFFLYYILERFIPICTKRNDLETADKYEKIKEQLKKALNTNGWDGRWFKRAFTDDGDILGSMENDECRIDNIAQCWSVISNAADNDKKYISMESLEDHLIDKENGIIKLLDPPFENGKLQPGYIKAYLPGVRENGGQYTHECCC